MTFDKNTQPGVEANPEDGAEVKTQPQLDEGNEPTKPQVDKDEGKKFTQQDLDNIAAKARGTAERETRKEILSKLGLKDDEIDKLAAFKQAYQDSLSEEEKKNQILEDLQADNLVLEQSLEEKEYVIKALIELTGKKEEDVDKIVKMAKGLKTDDNTIEDAIKEVISMVKVEDNPTKPASEIIDMPKSESIQQPSTNIQVSTQNNPWKTGSINLTKQAELIRTNPDLARKLMGEAGVKQVI